MGTTTPSSRLGRRIVVGATALALAVAGLTASGLGPASAASNGPSAVATVTSPTGAGSSTTTFTGSSTTVSVKISNTKTAIESFWITAPANVTQFAQVSGSPAGWDQTVGTCGGLQCLKYKATANKYYVGNGANGSVTFSITFKAPSTVGPFNLGFGYFSDLAWTTSLGTQNVSISVVGFATAVSGWCVTAPVSVTAGSPATFSAQARVKGTSTSTNPCDTTWSNSSYAGGTVSFGLGVADPDAVLPSTTFAQSASGTYPLSATFFKATGSQSISVTGGNGTGTSQTFAVAPKATSATLTLGTLTNGSASGTSFTKGDTVSGVLSAKDQYNNVVPLSSSASAWSATSTPASGFTPSYADNGNGTVTMSFTYNSTGDLSFTLTYLQTSPTLSVSSPAGLTFSIGAPASLTIDSITDTDGGTLFSGDVIAIKYTVKDANGNAISVPGTSVTVSATNTVDGQWIRTGTADNEVDGYWTIGESVNLKVAYSSTVYATQTVVFVFQDATNGGKFSPFAPATVSTNSQNGDTTCQDASQSCATVDLSNGANGTVNVSNSGSQITIDGNFKDPATGDPLYTNAKPMVVHYNCPESQCPLGSMPNNNGVTGNPADGASCYNGDGTVFTYPVTLEPYCVFSSAKESVEAAQSYHFEDALGTNPATNLVRYACQVDGAGNALLLNTLDTSVVYPAATSVPLHGQNGENLYSCLDVTSINWTVTGSGSADPTYTINYVILAADDYTTKLR
ncbi:MAG: hypothetical protein U0R68_11510 [Candidatus Nanopelagicales bacterium]